MNIEIQGSEIYSQLDFHNQFAKVLQIEHTYQYNLEDLHAVIGWDIQRPATLTWLNSEI